MYYLLQGLAGIAFIGALVFYVLVLVKMFQKNETTIAIVSIVTFVLCCIGIFFNLVYGWIKANEWNIKNQMIAFSACVGCWLLFGLLSFPFAPKLETNRTFQNIGNSLSASSPR